MKRLIPLLLSIITVFSFLPACDSLTGGDSDDDELIYEAPLTIESFEVSNVTQFSFDVSWNIVDVNGKVVEPNDINFVYKSETVPNLNGSGSGNGFKPDVNYIENGSVVNLEAICGRLIKMDVTFDVARIDFEYNETKTLEFTPPSCEFRLKLVDSFSGASGSSCDYYSEFTFSAYNKTYEDEFGEGMMPLFFQSGTSALTEDGAMKIVIADAQVNNTSNVTITDGATYSFGDNTNFGILGPLADKNDCSQAAAYDFNAAITLTTVLDNKTVDDYVIDDSYSF